MHVETHTDIWTHDVQTDRRRQEETAKDHVGVRCWEAQTETDRESRD